VTEVVELRAARIAARVKALGAELCSLTDAAGQEYLWQAGEAWPRHAPVLFPIVGRLHGDLLDFGGQQHRLGQHGFARDLPFRLMEHRADACRFVLTDSEATWDAFPFPFRLELAYALRGASVSVACTVENTGPALMPCSVGAHPALRWPLPGGASKLAHRLEFEQDEPAPVYRPDAEGLLDPTPRELPLKGRSLGLREEMFAEGAFVLLNPASRRLRFSAPGAAAVEVAWQGYVQLGIWTKPGADFLCIEPWAGHADVAGHRVTVWQKPGIMLLAPGEARQFVHRISLDG